MIVKVYQDPGYVTRILIALDELGAAILHLPNDVTISSWCGLWARQHGWRRWIGKWGHDELDEIQPKHCEYAVIHDEERAQFILDYLRGNNAAQNPGGPLDGPQA